MAAAASHVVIVVIELDILRPKPISADKFLISLGSFVLRVPRQHALQAHADALDILHRRPPLLAEQVETDDPVRVDVRMHRDGSVGKLHEDNFGWLYKWEAPHHQYESTRRAGRLHRAGQKEHTDGIRRAEAELEPVCLVLVERIGIEHLDIQEPFLEVIG
jgi:hypothetical protein